jgi:hypothetical protein
MPWKTTFMDEVITIFELQFKDVVILATPKTMFD